MQGRNARGKRRPARAVLLVAAGLFASLCLDAPLPAAADRPLTLILGQKTAPHHQEFMAGFRQAMADAGGTVDTVFLEPGDHRLEKDLATRANGRTLLIAVGSDAAFEATDLATTVPSLYTLIPRATYEALVRESPAPGGARRGALFVDQPVERILRLIRLALPQYSFVGSLQGPYSRNLLPELRASAAKMALTVIPADVEPGDKLERRLEPLLGQSQVLLTLPDADVVNSNTAKTIILGAYLRGVPIVGYSQSYVKAGALMAVHSTAAQIGRQTAEIALAFLLGNKTGLPTFSYPKYFSVSVNYQIAQALNLRIPSERELLDKMQAPKEDRDE